MQTDEATLRKTVAKNIAAYRKAHHDTQLDLATKLNYSDKSVSKWERGAGFPDVSLLEPLADALGLSVISLLHGERMDADGVSDQQVRRNPAAEGVEAALSYVHSAAVAGADDGGRDAPFQHVYDLQGSVSGVDVLCLRAAGLLDHLYRLYEPLVGHFVAGRVRVGAYLDLRPQPVSFL